MICEKAEPGLAIDMSDTMYPCRLDVIGPAEYNNHELMSDLFGTSYIYVLKGALPVVTTHGAAFNLQAGWYAAGPTAEFVATSGRDFLAVLIQRFGFRGQWSCGRVEERGRLSYIDGCSDTMLVYPPRLGDAVLNHLHFPPGIHQTQHTHPSVRLGMVIGGAGLAFRDPCGNHKGWTKKLEEGYVFALEEQELHSFATFEDPMDIVAFHPDSDWGPTDANHPMLNRTYINFGK